MTILSTKDLAGLRELAETRKQLDITHNGEKILCIEVDRFLRLVETAELGLRMVDEVLKEPRVAQRPISEMDTD
jgi:hypothetical protein